jgi:FkbM family methyltransferase
VEIAEPARRTGSRHRQEDALRVARFRAASLELARDSANAVLGRLGLRLSRAANYAFEPRPEDKYRWLAPFGFRTVLDVGAHEGQSALRFRRLFPSATIHSFEPLPDAFAQLERVLKGAPRQHCHHLALGDRIGTVPIHRSSWSQSSSLLEMADLHKSAYPFSAGTSVGQAPLETLDSVAARISFEPPILLKIDTQGFERQVLTGAEQTLSQVKLIIVETSFAELYVGQARFPEIYALLSEHDFEYRGSWDQLLSPKDGVPLQQDAIFARP